MARPSPPHNQTLVIPKQSGKRHLKCWKPLFLMPLQMMEQQIGRGVTMACQQRLFHLRLRMFFSRPWILWTLK